MSGCRRSTGNNSSLNLWAGVPPVELIGSGVSLTLLPLSTVAGLVTLAIGVTGNIDCSFNWLKDAQEHELVLLQSSSVVLQSEAQNEKVET